MPIKFSVILPNGAINELAGIKDPVEAYETMTHIAQTAEEVGFDTLWISDVLWPGDFTGLDASQEFLFECWTTTAALARDTSHVHLVCLGKEHHGFWEDRRRCQGRCHQTHGHGKRSLALTTQRPLP